MRVAELADRVRASNGIAHKRDIQLAFAGLSNGIPAALCANGDDCAAIPDGSSFLLFAIEGMLERFVSAEPWFAGYCSVMVNVSDVYAMGGRPIAVVDAIWCSRGEHAADVLSGMRAASAAYGVPIVGGHTNARSSSDYLAAAVLGRADHLLTSFDALPGDVLLAAIDLRGAFYKNYDYWNASTNAPPQRLRDDLEVLARLAGDGLCRAAKDISMGGILGTLMMLAECSHVGASIDLASIPLPPGVDLDRWLLTFPSYGFVLSVRPEAVDEISRRFGETGITCAQIGRCTSRRIVEIAFDGSTEELWDLGTTPLIGAVAHG